MICRLCGTCRQIENRHNWEKRHCARCHYLGLRAAFGYRGKIKVKPISKWDVNLARKPTTILTREKLGKNTNFANPVLKFITWRLRLFSMKTLKKIKDTLCKYCEKSFAPEVLMWKSQMHGHYICQDCFKDRQEKRLRVWLNLKKGISTQMIKK